MNLLAHVYNIIIILFDSDAVLHCIQQLLYCHLPYCAAANIFTNDKISN